MATARISDLTSDPAPPSTSILETETAAGGSRRSTIRQVLDTNVATTSVYGSVKKAAAVADLTGSISNPPTQAEVTNIYNKVNALLASLRTAGLLAP